MSKKKKSGLGGQGLNRLLTGKVTAEKLTTTGQKVQQLPIEALKPGAYQPRQQFQQEALNTLAESIKAQGMVQPIVARKLEGESYEIIAGERRWRAAQLAGLETVPVLVREADDQTTLALALIENLQREDLNPIEQAEGLARLLDEFKLTHEALAEAVGLSRTQVTNLLRLLKLAQPVQAMVHDGQLSMGHARALLALPEAQQHALAQKVVSQGWNVRQTEAAVKKLLSNAPAPSASEDKDPNIVALENRLSEKLGAKVNIRHHPNGRGKVEIRYTSPDELDQLLKQLAVEAL